MISWPWDDAGRQDEIAKSIGELIRICVQAGKDSASQWLAIKLAPRDGRAIDIWFVLSNGNAGRWANCQWDPTRKRWSGGPTDQGNGSWMPTHFMWPPAPPVDHQSDGASSAESSEADGLPFAAPELLGR